MGQHELYRIENIPVLQNRVFDYYDAAVKSPLGDVFLVQDLQTGLIFNSNLDQKK